MPDKENEKTAAPKMELREEWATDRPDANGGTKHDCIGLSVSVFNPGEPCLVTLYTDTPEFPSAEEPSTFDTTKIHLSPTRAREVAARLLSAADTCEALNDGKKRD